MGELVVSGGDAAKVLEAAEHAFDEVALLVGGRVVGYRPLASAGGGNDSFDSPVVQGRPEAVGIIGPVCNELREGAGTGEQGRRHADVSDVAGAQEQDCGPAFGVRQRVDLGVPTAARAADRLSKGPPFPPLAERCALTCVLSIATGPVM